MGAEVYGSGTGQVCHSMDREARTLSPFRMAAASGEAACPCEARYSDPAGLFLSLDLDC